MIDKVFFMNTIQRICSLFFITFFSLAPAVFQHGTYYPDYIELHNSSAQRIRVAHLNHMIDIKPGDTQSICVELCQAGSNHIAIYQGNAIYRVQFPIPNNSKSFSKESHIDQLDFATIQFLADGFRRVFNNGIDEIAINNDLLYKIAVIFSMNKAKTRSSIAKVAKPQETISQVVRDETIKRSAPCADQLSIKCVSQTAAPFKIAYLKRMMTSQDASNDNTWNSVTLSAKTIQAFHNGYSVETC